VPEVSRRIEQCRVVTRHDLGSHGCLGMSADAPSVSDGYTCGHTGEWGIAG
jgi:hypothetical protein